LGPKNTKKEIPRPGGKNATEHGVRTCYEDRETEGGPVKSNKSQRELGGADLRWGEKAGYAKKNKKN